MCDHPGEAQIWADNHHRFSEDMAALFASIGAAFATLQRIQYNAPWRGSIRRRRQPS